MFKYPWEKLDTSFESEKDFLTSARISGFTKEAAMVLLRCRYILAEAVSAVETGEVRHWQPEKPQSEYDTRKFIEHMEREWAKENGRERERTGAPSFSSMPLPAQMRLMELLQEAQKEVSLDRHYSQDYSAI